MVPQKKSYASIHQKNPHILRPLVKAYILGYASSTFPRLLSLLYSYFTGLRNGSESRSKERLIVSLLRILRGSTEWQRFPTFCASLVGGSIVLQTPLSNLVAWIARGTSSTFQIRLTRWLSTMIAAWLSIRLLQSREDDMPAKTEYSTPTSSPSAQDHKRVAGRTLDLTAFAVTRALDVIVGEIWARRKSRRLAVDKWTRMDEVISSLTDPSIFAISSALVMWSFIYSPDRLPRAYNKWIGGAAAVDNRLIVALRRVRWGELIYGKDTGQAPLLPSMCSDYKWPLVWGDPARTIPFPCEMVHMGAGRSCEWHAILRFFKGFLMALGMYGPLNSALLLRKPSVSALKKTIISSVRSSAFLGGFIAFYYYGVCLARTRIGPYILGRDANACQKIDSGICVGSGCALCGWTILLENEPRRKDIALFVAPRALATLLPRRYDLIYQWRETAIFAFSTAVVFTAVQEKPERVRGVLGKILAGVLND